MPTSEEIAGGCSFRCFLQLYSGSTLSEISGKEGYEMVCERFF